jgi:hypothetical protein
VSQSLVGLVVALGALLVIWYLVGNEVMRRRGRTLAVWCKRALDPMGGSQAIQWITTHSFRLEVHGLRPPFTEGSLTGLAESWDVPMIWAINRMNGRRDMVLLQLGLRQQPVWGLELYRPGSVLAGDARHAAAQEGWTERQLDSFRLASTGGDAPERLARELISELGDQSKNLVRLAIRRQGMHLTLAMNVPDRTSLSPDSFARLIQQLARATLRYATPPPPD